jgi:hypothetical protein
MDQARNLPWRFRASCLWPSERQLQAAVNDLIENDFVVGMGQTDFAVKPPVGYFEAHKRRVFFHTENCSETDDRQ